MTHPFTIIVSGSFRLNLRRVRSLQFSSMVIEPMLLIIVPTCNRYILQSYWAFTISSCHVLFIFQRVPFPHPHGFRGLFSCGTHAWCNLLTTLVYQRVKSFTNRCNFFLYFSEAFDRVSHKRLAPKLASLNLEKLVFTRIKRFLSHRLQYTTVNTYESGLTNITSEVPFLCRFFFTCSLIIFQTESLLALDCSRMIV